MLRFNARVEGEAEFQLVNSSTKSKKLKLPKSNTEKGLTTKEEKVISNSDVLQPAWLDEDDPCPSELVRPPHVLDVCASKRRVGKEQGSQDEDISDDETTVKCTSKILRGDDGQCLPNSKTIDVRRVFDANRERISMGPLVSVQFNPAYQMSLTASADSTLAFFTVDGTENALLRDRVFEKYPLSSAKFTAQGDRVVLTGNRNSFRLYDLHTGEETRASPFIGSDQEDWLIKCELSSGQPNLVALGTNKRQLYLADLRSMEKVSVIRTAGDLQSFCFVEDGAFLCTFDASGSVFLYDLRSRRPRAVHQWSDQACTGATVICSSSDSRWIACGSSDEQTKWELNNLAEELSLSFVKRPKFIAALETRVRSSLSTDESVDRLLPRSDCGFVNVYQMSATMKSSIPEPDKSVSNLQTCIDAMAFHPGSEMLCFASSQRTAAVRLYNLHGRQVFDNFPVRVGRLGVASSLAFSPGGGYLCVGQQNGRAALYRLSRYRDY